MCLLVKMVIIHHSILRFVHTTKSRGKVFKVGLSNIQNSNTCDRNPVTSFTTGMQERTRTFPECNNKLQMDYLREQMMVIYFVNKMSVIEIVKDKSATYPFVTRTFRKVVSPDTFYRKIQQHYGLLLDKECRVLLRCVQRV
jgi:hypothetical protein